MRAGVEIELGTRGPLTEREAEALLWTAAGKTSWEVGRIMGTTEATAVAHLKSATAKLEARNRPHLVARAFLRGILRTGTVLLLCLAMVASAPTSGVRHRLRTSARRQTVVAQFCAHH